MENTDNKPHSEEKPSETPQTPSCCSVLFSSREDGSRKPSPLLWAILVVIVIGVLGIASSSKADHKKADRKAQAVTAQLQKPPADTKSAAPASLKDKIQKESLAAQANRDEAIVKKMQAMQDAHSQQMEQAHKAFEVLKSAYAKKLNETVDAMKAEQAIQAQEVPNPELNFQLRGVSNVRVQFNRAKDISYIEIIQPDGQKSWNSKKDKEPSTDSYSPKKIKEANDYNKCQPKEDEACATMKCYEAPKWDKKDNQDDWDCNTSKPQSGCWQ